jgi:hypothetical protein
MPDGNYDIFIIPPHSAGSGFLYLPSLAVQRNSFLAGVACALLAVGLYTLVVPVLKSWLETMMASGGIGMLLLLIGIGVAGWAWGKTQGEQGGGGAGGASAANGAGARTGQNTGPGAMPKSKSYAPPPPRPEEKSNAQSGWEKAREETRKREEARKREEELKKKREDGQKAREEAERTAKAKAEKEKWEQARAREKEQREREARERIARERREKDTREREARETAKARSAHSSPTKPTHPSNYHKPTARSVEEEYSYRPYDAPPKRPGFKSSASSISGVSESSYAPSHSTARTTPPPSQRGPYSTKDPDKIQIRAVYLFSDSFPMKPIASLIAAQGSVTDGLVLRIKTEGLFIDDDIRGVPQREWDVKAWTLKLVEDGMTKNQAGVGVHVLRATTRDAENKKYTFVLDETEAWKVAVGLARLRKGSQVRALGMNGMKESEVRGLLSHLGWM